MRTSEPRERLKQTRRKTSAPITHSGWNRLALVAAERPAETVEAAVVATASPASPKVAPLRSRERRRSLRGLHNAPAHTRLLESLRRSPAFLIAAFLHLLLVVIFSFGAVAAHYEEEQLPIGLSLAPRDPAGLDAAPVRQLDSSSEPPPLADVPLTAAPQLVFAPSMAESKSPAPARLGVGAGGGGGGSAGNGKGSGKGRGASTGSGRAIGGGLKWLARHQSKSGGWGLVSEDHVDPEQTRPTATDSARTGLAVLCFLSAGHSPHDPGPYRDVLRRGLSVLAGAVSKEGRIRGSGYDEAGSDGYHQAIAILALAEGLLRGPDTKLQAALERAVACALRTQIVFSDKSVRHENLIDSGPVGWMVMALEVSKRAGCEVPPTALPNALAYFDAVTDPHDGTINSSDHAGCSGMAAEGLFMRLLLGQSPTTPTNKAAAHTVAAQCHLDWDRASRTTGIYGAHFAMLALPRVGGRMWRAYNLQIRDQIVRHQHRAEGCRHGSWLGSDFVGDRVLATCFATLTIQSYFRYEVAKEQAGLDTIYVLNQDVGLMFEAEEAARIALAKKDRDLNFEARGLCKQALKTLAAADWDRRSRLHLLMFQLARGRGESGAAHVRAYRAALPSGALVHVAEGARLIERAQRALASAATSDRLTTELTRFAAQVEADLELLPSESQVGAQALCDRIRELELRLQIRAGRTASLMASLRAKAASLQARGPLQSAELRLWIAVCTQVSARLVEADRSGTSAGALEFARAGIQELLARRLPERLSRGQRGRYLPLLAQAELNYASLLVHERRWRQAAEVCATWLERHTGHASRTRVATLERHALLQLAHAQWTQEGKLDLDSTRRLKTILAADPRRTDVERRTLARCCEELGELGAALEEWSQLRGVGSPDEQIATRLTVARLECGLGHHERALAELEALPDSARERLEVVLEICLVRRALGQHEAVLVRYVSLLRFLDRSRPEWWTVAYQVALTHLEANQFDEASAFLEELRRADRTFGGSSQRRTRFLKLARRSELLKSGAQGG